MCIYGISVPPQTIAKMQKIAAIESDKSRMPLAGTRLDVKCPLKSIAGGLIEKEVIAQLGAVHGSPEFMRLAANDAGC